MNSWMKNIPDDFLISEINLVGTHNSATQFIRFKHFSKCQNKNIFDQLSMGIRFLDIRLKFDGERLILCHSIFHCKKSRRKKEDLLFTDVLENCRLFLNENPTETIFMSVKREAGKNNEKTFDFLYENYIKNSNLFFTMNEIPHLSQVRGKIVLLNRIGADIENSFYTDENSGINLSGWPYQNSRKEGALQKVPIPSRKAVSRDFFFVQDFFNLKPEKKWELAILPTLDKPPQDASLVFNFFSASNGFSSPKKYSKLIYRRFSEYKLMPMKKYGWFILDFPNEKIIKKIILSNY
ncbi:MAG: phosphatidylinositol-specific phospholipase C domain-containing protein [Clostridia bacterium]|nr:phosphatidylinositol-specific phospholipase C domain-containing protein [Clostridia bacterium]